MYVYVLKAGINHYKVGISSNVKQRVATIRTDNPQKIYIVLEKETDIAHTIEAHAHAYLKEHGTGGGTEWFQLTPEQVVRICIFINQYESFKPKPTVGQSFSKIPYVDKEKWLLEEAKKAIFYEQKSSTSFLQRRFRIGYGRASRIIETLEKEGFVSELDGIHRTILGSVLLTEKDVEKEVTVMVDQVLDSVSDLPEGFVSTIPNYLTSSPNYRG